jgi:serine/threonine-protein kinase
VTADNTGTVYVNDAGNERVMILLAGSTTQITLPFTDFSNPTGLTVDSSRTVYVTDTAKNRVVALPAGSNTQTELPFTGLNGPTGFGGKQQRNGLRGRRRQQSDSGFTRGLEDASGAAL